MKFKIFILKNPLARKIFGRAEILIIKKQIEGINLSQSEKNRLSRDIRPKLKFIEEAARFRDKFDLKKGLENKELIDEAVGIIKEDLLSKKIRRIFLFGSIIDNKLTSRSDIDIAVLFDNIDISEATKFRIRVSGKVGDKIDVQVFNILPEKIKEEILKKGKTLYKNEK